MGLTLYPASEAALTHGADPEGRALWSQAKAMEEAVFQAAKDGRDVPATDILDLSQPWALTAAMMHALSMGRDLGTASTADWYSAVETENWFCREGYGTLLMEHHSKTPVTINTFARHVTVTKDGVTVETDRGQITAAAAIVTVSMGVLAAEAIRFNPPLEVDHLRAIEAITLGDYNHTVLQFAPGALPVPEDCWVSYSADTIKDGSVQGGGFLCNISGSGLTTFETCGQFSRDLQAAGQGAAIEAAMSTLCDIFGAGIRAYFVKGLSTEWGRDPLVRGSYSGAMPGQSHRRKDLRTPHAERILFAGEATHLCEQATVPGAHKEGQRAARRALDLLT